ncbi:MAG: GAF domain-containing sensor histidine kinase [Actinobacteria bacterium]|nr:MAG: GAF domain-containing sensor histidine kinase [Actinomycetota bacterium]
MGRWARPAYETSARDTGADPFQPSGSVSIRMSGRPDRNEMLLEAALALSSELSLDAVLQRLVELAAAATSARYGALGVLGAEGRIVEFVTTGLTQEQRDTIGALPVGHGVLGVLIEEPRVLRLADVSKHPHSIGFPPNHPPMKSFLGAPVKAKGQVFGNLYLTEKQGAQEFDEEDEKALIALAAQAGVAVENARLHEELRRLAILDDRERIAKELHDGAIQSLFAVGMGLEVTAQLSGDPNVQTRLQGASEEVDRVIRDLRNYIFGLRPGILADRQLDQALRHLVTDFEGKTGIIIAVEIDGEVAAELASRAGEVIQLAREALSNVGRHAEATTCRLSLIRTTDRALLEVDDDGRGFDTTAQNGPGQGLRNLRDRAASLGGELSIQSAPGEGTTVRVSIPI